jgi:ABC-type antimicrobial peptide transport system permease subunit
MLAFGVTRYLQGAIFGMEAAGLLEFSLAVLPILIAAVAASYLPSRRAARLDPTLALRHE